jgi:cytochrome P450
MSTAVAPALPVPPRPVYPERQPTLRQFLRASRTNALLIWPDEAYRRDVVVTRNLGHVQMLLNAPEPIHRVLVENPGNYRRTPASYRILRPVTGDGLLLSEGEAWRHQRRTIAPALAPRVMPMLSRHVGAVAAERVAALRGKAGGGPVDLLEEMQFAALEIAGRSMFSLEMSSFGTELRERIAAFGARLAQPHLLDMLLPPSIPAPRDFARRRFRREWLAFMDRLIEARLAAGDGRDAPRDLFDLLRAARDPETAAAFSREQLRDHVATMIVAGHETTAVALFWALYLLAGSPEWQGEIAAETEGLDLGAAGAPDALSRLVRTRAVVDEALRLYPPAFTMIRAANAADRAGALAIPRNAVLMISPWVLGRHRGLWRDPDAFDPSRFLPGAPPPPRFAYLPFGTGPRVCVGAQFALAEATLVLAAMVQAFRIGLADDRPVMPQPIVTTQPDRAPGFVLEPRA